MQIDRALANCAALSRERLVIESYCIDALLPSTMASEPIMRFLPDPQRFPEQGQPNRDPSNFWGFTSACLQRMIEDVGFAVRRNEVGGDRVLIDAWRAVSDRVVTRSHTAYGVRPPIGVGDDPDDPSAWTLF